MRNLPKSSPKIVLDSSALISLMHGGILNLVLSEFEVVISSRVVEELEETSEYKDMDGKAANKALKQKDRLKIRKVKQKAIEEILTSRVHSGEASCIILAKDEEIEAMISDDFDAMNQLEYYSRVHDFALGLCSALIKALILREKLTAQEGEEIFDEIARKRNWMGRQIYKYGKKTLL